MIYYLIKDSSIQNMIEADESMRHVYESMGYVFLKGSNTPGSPSIGWIYDGQSFYPPAD